MNRASLMLRISVGTLAIGAAGAHSAAAATTPVLIGQPAGTAIAGCTCLAVQLTDTGTSSYVIPFDGVLTRSNFTIGSFTSGTNEWVRAETLRKLGGTQATVISEGTKHIVTGISPAGPRNYLERIPASAGDVLGGEFDTTPIASATPSVFSGAAADQAGSFPGSPSVGQIVNTTGAANQRVNMQAVLEADADHDGYGDFSQDLCPGSPLATGACSGTLFGSDLQESLETTSFCGYACLRVQKTIGGHSTAAPYDGVVVRWRMLNPSSGEFGIRVVQPNGTGTYLSRGSDVRSVIGSGPLVSQIASFPTRLPIPAGAYVGLVAPAFASTVGFENEAGSSYGVSNDDPAAGATIVETVAAHPGTMLYDADIEPDADHDGFGDISQDGCPSDPASHDACPPVAAGSSASAGTTAPSPSAQRKPSISGFRAVPKRVPFEGSAKLRLLLSDAAEVTFTTEARVACRGSGKHCQPWHRVHAFQRALPAGTDTVPYPAGYRRHGRDRWLAPGSYRIAAVPSSSAGAGTTVRAAFTVLPPA